MRKYWVYVHTCPNGKKYVGITTRIKPEIRWKKGKGYQYNDHFYKAILKYGWDNIEHEVFEADSAEEMYYAEKYLIAYYHTTESEFGYNHSVGGECSSLGCKHSEETKKKISEANRGKKLSKEHRKKLSEAIKGKPHKTHSEETRKKMSEAKKGKPLSEEHRRKISEARKGKPHPQKPFSEEHRKHLAEVNRRKAKDPEIRRKQSEAAKNIPRISIKLPDGTIVETTKSNLVRNYVNKKKEFEYVS